MNWYTTQISERWLRDTIATRPLSHKQMMEYSIEKIEKFNLRIKINE